MSTSKNNLKKPTAKTEDKPKYQLGAKLFFVDNSGSKTMIRVGKVDLVDTKQLPIKDEKGRVTGKEIVHLYSIVSKGREFEVSQGQLYPTFPLVANAFAKLFLESHK